MNQNWTCTRLGAIVVVVGFVALVAGYSGGRNDETITSRTVDLKEDNWQLMLHGEWMVEFFAPWCPACKNLAPTWERFASTAAQLNVKVAVIDVTTSPSLSGRFFVTALPTIYHVLDGEFRHYRGSRDADSLYNFLKQKQWENITPISGWKRPDTIHMSILSYFFKLSHALKDLNMYLQEEYNLPTWASYTLFAFATIFVGAALGLLLVFLVDSLYPPKKLPRQSFVETKERDAREGIEDLDRDELEDENEASEDVNEEDDGDDNNNDDEEDEIEDVEIEDDQEENIKTEEKQSKTKTKTVAPTTTTPIIKSKATDIVVDDKSNIDKKTTNSKEEKSSSTEMRKRNKSRKAD